MCGSDSCRGMVGGNFDPNDQKTLHTEQECRDLSKSGLGTTIKDIGDEDFILECIFIYRM